MARLRILLTCTTLARRSGSEAYTRDLAVGLLRQGHAPVVYSTEMGEMAHEIKMATVPVVDDLARLSVPPDVIHGNHHLELMTALLHFPGVPGLHVCHAWNSVEASPPRFPRILRYVAVDETSRDRLLLEDGVPEAQVRVHFNSVDLDRFRPRGALPPKPLRALVFSNYASEHTHLPAVREACTRAGIALDAIGSGVGNSVPQPELALGGYDLVFAKARSALESMAVGTAVVLCDSTGVGPMVTAAELDALRQSNFEIRTLRYPLDAEVLAREIARYDAADAAEVSRRVRATAGLDEAAQRMVEIYQELIGEHRGATADREEEERAASTYLRWLSVTSREARHDLTSRTGRAETDRDRLSDEIRQLRAQQEALEERLGTTEAERESYRAEVAYVTQSATWRLRNRLARWKPLMSAYLLFRRSRR
ncbi:MAG TPA: glycosyltransferase [Thermoanaerobaculia bacterium]|nr:glycosyltransferase [Thermoanaerobaculia bacterium]